MAKPRRRPTAVTTGMRKLLWPQLALALRHDVQRYLDIDFRVQVHRHKMRAHGLDVRLGQPNDPLIEVWSTGLLDGSNHICGGHRAEQLPRIS